MANQPTYPYGECWVDSKASRVKCTASPPLTLSISMKIAKRSEATEQETCQGLRSNRVAAWPLQVGGDQMLSGWGVGVSRRRRLHPATRRAWGLGQRPGSVNKPLGGRVVGGMCQRHSFKGLSFYSYEQPGTRCSEYTLKFAAGGTGSLLRLLPPCRLVI